MFIVVLLTIAKTWNQLRCPSMVDWIKKIWSIYTMEYYAAIQKNKIMFFAATWMELETIILSELTQKQKIKYHMFYLQVGTNQWVQMGIKMKITGTGDSQKGDGGRQGGEE